MTTNKNTPKRTGPTLKSSSFFYFKIGLDSNYNIRDPYNQGLRDVPPFGDVG